jgi:hypothetical protein
VAKGSKVERSTKRSEYEIRFASVSARRGWVDLFATIRGPLAERGTSSPDHRSSRLNYPLKGELQRVTRDGVAHERWQHKPTAHGDARIWFYVEGRVVHLEQVHTKHQNQTK